MKILMPGSESQEVHPNMVKLINHYNSLQSKDKTIVLSALGINENISDEAAKILEILNNIGADHKTIFIDLIKNNVKLSWSEDTGLDSSGGTEE